MNKQIRQHAKNIFLADYKNLLIAGLIYAFVDIIFLSVTTNNIIATSAMTLLSSFVSASSAYFYFNAYIKEKSNFEDMYIIFTDSKNFSKLMSIIITLWLIYSALYIIVPIISIIPIISIFGIVFMFAISFLLVYVWYLYAANTSYPTSWYFKASAKYIGFNYIRFIFSLVILPAIIQVLLNLFLPLILVQIIMFPVNIYISLATAGFVANTIPSEWYSGTAYFN